MLIPETERGLEFKAGPAQETKTSVCPSGLTEADWDKQRADMNRVLAAIREPWSGFPGGDPAQPQTA